MKFEEAKKILINMLNNHSGQEQAAIKTILETFKKPALRVEYSEDKKLAYFNGHEYRKHKDGYYVRREPIQVAVIEYYTGTTVTSDFEVHHTAKDKNGNWDKSKNDIEHLQLLTVTQHRSIHKPNGKLRVKTFVCEYCKKEFQAENKGQNRFCSSKCLQHWHYYNDLEERICAYCGKKFMTYKYNRKTKCCSMLCGSRWRDKIRKVK